ncbi:MAG TPA: hypothetical protein VGV93_02175 [Acidimicrobiales bacterium]|nr:hypothetical protein [Acidimicrobiales bacterium]
MPVHHPHASPPDADCADPIESKGPPPRRRRVATAIVAAAGGLALGVGLTLALTEEAGEDVRGALEDAAVVTPTTAVDDAVAPPGAGAATPVSTVEGFLDAEIDGELTASFGFLSAEDRAELGSPAGWIAAHADILAPVTGYEVRDAGEAPSGGAEVEAEVVTLVTFEPGLDEVRGLISERASVTWATTADATGSWGIDLGATTIEPLHPSDEGAPAAVARWAEAHQACRPARTWEGALKGSPALAEGLCGSGGAVEVGPPLPLTSVDAGPFLAAFGPGAGEWARVVTVTAPVEVRAVVAPIGQDWLVIGVLPA